MSAKVETTKCPDCGQRLNGSAHRANCGTHAPTPTPAEHSPLPWSLGISNGLIYCTARTRYETDEQPAVAACSPEAAKNAAFIDDHYSDNPICLSQLHRANAAFIVRACNSHQKLVQVIRCALADLEGIMPEFEPSGDRKHPAWTTIEELRAALAEVVREG